MVRAILFLIQFEEDLILNYFLNTKSKLSDKGVLITKITTVEISSQYMKEM